MSIKTQRHRAKFRWHPVSVAVNTIGNKTIKQTFKLHSVKITVQLLPKSKIKEKIRPAMPVDKQRLICYCG